MDPDGTIYFVINLTLSFILCLYIAATRRNEDYDDFAIGVSKNLISALLCLILDIGVLVYITLPSFKLVWLRCVLGALFVFIGIILPYCLGIAQYNSLEKLTKTLSPFITVINYTITAIAVLPTVLVFKLFKLDTQTEVTQQDVMDLVEDASDDIIDDDQKEMIENIFELDDTTVGEIMTHRTEVFAVGENETCRSIIAGMHDQGFSRIPVYSNTIDTITGILYAKDLLCVVDDPQKLEQPVSTLARKPMFVPQSCPANDLMVQFKLKHTQMAVVVDEYGGTSGIITMEDILEEIVGNIQDEFDDEEEEFHKIDSDTIICKASMDIDDALELLGIENQNEDDSSYEDFDTVGGLIIDRLARIPQQGETAQVEYMGAVFTVVEVADRRIVKVKVQKISTEQQE